MLMENMVQNLREIVAYAQKSELKVMLENVSLSNGIHKIEEFKYIIDNISSLYVHLHIAHAFTSGGMKSVIDYITTLRKNNSYPLAG
jgi:sugar phosphate isomerase/epimerase